MVRRAANGGMPRVVCNCIPKSGTHLLERTLCLHRPVPSAGQNSTRRTDHVAGNRRLLAEALKPGQMYFCHILYRDYLAKHSNNMMCGACLWCETCVICWFRTCTMCAATPGTAITICMYGSRTFAARLMYALVGDPEKQLPGFGQRMEAFAGWLDCAHVVRLKTSLASRAAATRQSNPKHWRNLSVSGAGIVARGTRRHQPPSVFGRQSDVSPGPDGHGNGFAGRGTTRHLEREAAR